MAFGTGTLVGAAAFELVRTAIEKGGLLGTAIGFLGGAIVFTIGELFIAKKGGKERKQSKENPIGHSGMAIFIGTLLDATPESAIIGVSIVHHSTVSLILLISIFISNLPEGLSSSIGLKKDGYSKTKILILWSFVLLVSTISSLLGFLLLQNSTNFTLAIIHAFAAGGIISMVSSTMMPEAFEEGGPVVGFITSLGLLTSLLFV